MCQTHTNTQPHTHTHTHTHTLSSPPVPLDFVYIEVTPVIRKYKRINVAIIPIPIATFFREVFMKDERPS